MKKKVKSHPRSPCVNVHVEPNEENQRQHTHTRKQVKPKTHCPPIKSDELKKERQNLNVHSFIVVRLAKYCVRLISRIVVRCVKVMAKSQILQISRKQRGVTKNWRNMCDFYFSFASYTLRSAFAPCSSTVHITYNTYASRVYLMHKIWTAVVIG